MPVIGEIVFKDEVTRGSCLCLQTACLMNPMRAKVDSFRVSSRTHALWQSKKNYHYTRDLWSALLMSCSPTMNASPVNFIVCVSSLVDLPQQGLTLFVWKFLFLVHILLILFSHFIVKSFYLTMYYKLFIYWLAWWTSIILSYPLREEKEK